MRATDWLCLQVDALLAHAEVMQTAGRTDDARRSAAGSRAHRGGEGLRGGRAERPGGRTVVTRSYLDLPLRDFLGEVASPEPMPGAGYCAAISLSMAAGLVAMAAGASRGRVGGGEGRRRAGQHPARAHRAAGAAQPRGLRERGRAPAGHGRRRASDLGLLLERAAQIPLDIAEAAVDVASLAAVVAERGEQALRADAVAGALLAQGAARAAATLVEVNLGTTSIGRARHARAGPRGRGHRRRRARLATLA